VVAVYLIQDEVTRMVKIGRAKDPNHRLRGLQTGHGHRLVLREVLVGDSKEETFVHRYFATYRRLGEWFAIPDEILDQEIPALRSATAEMSANASRDQESIPKPTMPPIEELGPDWGELQTILSRASRRTPFTQYVQEHYEELSDLIAKHGARWKVIARWAVEEGHTNGATLSGSAAMKAFDRETARRVKEGLRTPLTEAH
jgi:hypothetical protein